MTVYGILACVLVGLLVFPVICLGISMVIIAVGMTKNNGEEETEDDVFGEDEIAE